MLSEMMKIIGLGVRQHGPQRDGERRGLSTCRETGGFIRPRLPGLSPRTPDTGWYACLGAEATHGLALRAPAVIMPRGRRFHQGNTELTS